MPESLVYYKHEHSDLASNSILTKDHYLYTKDAIAMKLQVHHLTLIIHIHYKVHPMVKVITVDRWEDGQED